MTTYKRCEETSSTFLSARGVSTISERKLGNFLVNDQHSQLNATRVSGVVKPASLGTIQQLVINAKKENKHLCIAGQRHSMGGQQFASDSVLVDLSELNGILNFNPIKRTVEVESGVQWPQLISYLNAIQSGQTQQWTIAQKQTGADNLTIGGALASNIHGRGLSMKPFISDIDSFVLVDANGMVRQCSRTENTDLFRLAIGGYGLFGIVYSVVLKLVPRQKLQRIVEIIELDELMARFEQRIDEGFLYGDFQYAIDPDSAGYLNRGILSCYRPVSLTAPIPPQQKSLTADHWRNLVQLAHTDKKLAFELYAAHYFSTYGQIYWSDTHQLSVYLENYHKELDNKLHAVNKATEIITEIYVPREQLVSFMREVAQDFKEHQVNVIYGTVRLIEQDNESFLAWAKQSYACVIFNIHTEHTTSGLLHTRSAMQRLIDKAIQRDGSYYLTYHKFATPNQVKACYPQFSDFLRWKRKYDPHELFQSDWYQHYKNLIY